MGKRSRLGERAGEGEVVLGEIVGTFGLQGELRVYLFNPEERWEERDVVLVSADGKRDNVKLSLRPGAGRRILGRIPGVGNPEQAGDLVGAAIIMRRELLPDLEEDTWYHSDLIGMRVTSQGGTELGRIVAIHDHAEVDVWEVHGPLGTRLVPAISDIVLSVALDAGVVVADSVVEQHEI